MTASRCSSAALDRCDALLDRALLPVLFEDDTGLVDQTGWTQPALFSLEYALCALWRSWGVEPSVVLGHSVGNMSPPAWPGCSAWRRACRWWPAAPS